MQKNENANATECKFELETGFDIPKVRRVGRHGTIYPFAKMEVGHSFHVAKSEDKPNPVKNLASAVSTANKRYKDENGNTTRKFVIRRAGQDDPKGPGARIFRVE